MTSFLCARPRVSLHMDVMGPFVDREGFAMENKNKVRKMVNAFATCPSRVQQWWSPTGLLIGAILQR